MLNIGIIGCGKIAQVRHLLVDVLQDLGLDLQRGHPQDVVVVRQGRQRLRDRRAYQ